MVLELTAANFDKEVRKSSEFVLVDFWAEWCGPCKRMAPVFEELADDFHGRVKFAKLNTEEAPDIAQEIGIQSIPCLVLFKNGKEIERIVGFQQKDALRDQVDEIVLRAT